MRITICCAVCAVLLGACSKEPTHLTNRPNLLLITVDTLRTDRLGAFGASVETPASDRLADNGFTFKQALTTNTVTLPAHSTVMTGRLPHEHHVHDNVGYKLEENQLTLAEILSDSGYQTAGFVGAFVLDGRFGIAQGFSHYDDDLSQGFSSQHEIGKEKNVGHCTQAWRILEVPNNTTSLKISAPHRAESKDGEFEYLLLSDDDGDKAPDRYIERSPVMQGAMDEWSSYTFKIPTPAPQGLFVGMTWRSRGGKRISYAQGLGTLSNWKGLEQKVWFSRSYAKIPDECTDGPRACDLRVVFLDAQGNETGHAGLEGDEIGAVNGGRYWNGLPYQNFERRAETVVDSALAWLEKAEEPWFVWVHVFDPHIVYLPPEPFLSEYEDKLYDGEVAYAEHHLNRIMQWLDQTDRFDSTAIVYSADHGESLGEHDYWGHGNDLYEPCLHVPLFVKPPYQTSGEAVDDMVSLVSVAPTALELLGIEIPTEISAKPLLTHQKQDDNQTADLWDKEWQLDRTALTPFTFSETYRYERPYKGGAMLGIRSSDWKLIMVPRDDEKDAYHLTEDPEEVKPLRNHMPLGFDKPYARLPELLDLEKSQPNLEDMTEEEIERLKAGGYL